MTETEKLEKIHTDRVLIVEGKYDAARLSHLTDAMILMTDGFGIYSDKKRQQLFKALAQKNGLILLTDSDAAGFRIRNYITNLVGEKNVVQAYVPAIHGKEKRKAAPGNRTEGGSLFSSSPAWDAPGANLSQPYPVCGVVPHPARDTSGVKDQLPAARNAACTTIKKTGRAARSFC